MGISVEVATLRMAEILVSQTWFLSGVPDRLGRAMCRETDADWLWLIVIRVGNSTARSVLGGLGRSLDQAGCLRMVCVSSAVRTKAARQLVDHVSLAKCVQPIQPPA